MLMRDYIFQEFSLFVFISFSGGTNDPSEFSVHSTVIDPSFLVQSSEILNLLQQPGGFPISSHELS